jgi:hypothetical protein
LGWIVFRSQTTLLMLWQLPSVIQASHAYLAYWQIDKSDESAMIAGIEGILKSRGEDWVVVEVNGVSFRLQSPTSTIGILGMPRG